MEGGVLGREPVVEVSHIVEVSKKTKITFNTFFKSPKWHIVWTENLGWLNQIGLSSANYKKCIGNMSAKNCIVCKASNHCVQASDNSIKHIHILKHNFNVSQGMFLRHTSH